MVKPNKLVLNIGLILGATGVVLGALGAHMLKNILDSQALASFETGVKYQIFHALFIIALSILPGKKFEQSALITFVGVLMFSISIYCLSIDEYIGLNLRFLGPVTPLGGILMIAGWIRPIFGKSN